MYIYVLLENNIVFYVGKTTDLRGRYAYHRMRFGKTIQMALIDKCSISESHYLERYYIKKFINKGFLLKNKDFRNYNNEDFCTIETRNMKIIFNYFTKNGILNKKICLYNPSKHWLF